MVTQWAAQKNIAQDHIATLDYFVMSQYLLEPLKNNSAGEISLYFYQQAITKGSAVLCAKDLQALSLRAPDYYLQVSKQLVAQPPTSLSVVIDVNDKKAIRFIGSVTYKAGIS